MPSRFAGSRQILFDQQVPPQILLQSCKATLSSKLRNCVANVLMKFWQTSLLKTVFHLHLGWKLKNPGSICPQHKKMKQTPLGIKQVVLYPTNVEPSKPASALARHQPSHEGRRLVLLGSLQHRTVIEKIKTNSKVMKTNVQKKYWKFMQ